MNNFPGLWFNFLFFCCILMRFYDLQFSKACSLMSYVSFQIFQFYLSHWSLYSKGYLFVYCVIQTFNCPSDISWPVYPFHTYFRCHLIIYQVFVIQRRLLAVERRERIHCCTDHYTWVTARRKWSSGQGWMLDGNKGFRCQTDVHSYLFCNIAS